jgi:ribosomal subunit interface protein
MHTDIFAKNVELNAPLREFVEEKMADLERLLGQSGPALARVEIGISSNHHTSGSIYYAEVNIDLSGHVIRAQSTNYDLHAAIVDVKNELKVQIKKFKEKEEER